ncbi:MAG TPA: hypothetical protein VK358_11005 [Longimicrobium sp.]|nr:hypothetical protein [Longimicrobium sp.]
MRLRSILPVFLLPLLSAQPPQPREDRVVSGYYTVGWEEQSFRPCGARSGVGDNGAWWVSNPGPMMGAYRDLVEGDWGTIFVTVRMDLSERGRWGHLGGYSRSVAVVELIDARRPSRERDDCSRVRETE